MESCRYCFFFWGRNSVEATSAFLLQTFGEMRSCEFLKKKSEGLLTSYHPSSCEAQFTFGFYFFFFLSFYTLFCLFLVLFYEYSIKRERVNGCSTYIFLGPHD